MSRAQARDVRNRTTVLEVYDTGPSPAEIADQARHLAARLEYAQLVYGFDYGLRMYRCDSCNRLISALAPLSELPDAGYPCANCGRENTVAIAAAVGGP
jgi:DNA-directed RNA polymerase subunit RPC12/RpoP